MLLKFKESRERWACNPSTGKPIIEFVAGDIKEIKKEYCMDLIDSGMAEVIDPSEAPEADEAPDDDTPAEDADGISMEEFEDQLEQIAQNYEKATDAKDRLEEIGHEFGLELNKSKSVKNLIKELIAAKKDQDSE